MRNVFKTFSKLISLTYTQYVRKMLFIYYSIVTQHDNFRVIKFKLTLKNYNSF